MEDSLSFIQHLERPFLRNQRPSIPHPFKAVLGQMPTMQGSYDVSGVLPVRREEARNAQIGPLRFSNRRASGHPTCSATSRPWEPFETPHGYLHQRLESALAKASCCHFLVDHIRDPAYGHWCEVTGGRVPSMGDRNAALP